MTTAVVFPQPKDPADSTWYKIQFGEAIATLSGVTVTESLPPGRVLGPYSTSGDAAVGSTLTASNAQIAADTMGVAFRLSGGVPGKCYAVRATAVTVSGSTLNRSAILLVTGL